MGSMELEGKSILKNIPFRVESATEEMVEEACWAALFHEFMRDLMDLYETVLGEEVKRRAGCSEAEDGYCKARLRNPSILHLGQSSFHSIHCYLHFLFSKRRRYIGTGPHFLHLGIQSSQALAQNQNNYCYHTIEPRSDPRALYMSSRTEWLSNKGFSMIWRLNQNTDMKGRKVNSE